MKYNTFIAAALAMLAAAPAAAQTMPLIIATGTADRITLATSPSLDRQIKVAVEAACAKPFIRDLKGWELYEACLTEAYEQVDVQLAERAAAVSTEIALR